MHICGDIFLLLHLLFFSFSSFSGISLSSSFDLSVVLFQFASLPFPSPIFSSLFLFLLSHCSALNRKRKEYKEKMASLVHSRARVRAKSA
jgi:hypothetical protein